MISYSSTRWWSKWECMKQIMLYFADIESFLLENDTIGQSCRPKLLGFPWLCALLKVELAATIDYGEPFVKSCYFLEGDGPLSFECCESISRVLAAIQTQHTPNVDAIIQSLTGKPLSDPVSQQYVVYAKACVQPGLDYFKHQLQTNLKSSLSFFKTAHLFLPQKVHSLKPDAATIDTSFKDIPFVESSEISSLKSELPDYLSRADGTAADYCPLEWWKLNCVHLPVWSKVARKILLIQPSSAAVERVFSILNSSFGPHQNSALQDYNRSFYNVTSK